MRTTFSRTMFTALLAAAAACADLPTTGGDAASAISADGDFESVALSFDAMSEGALRSGDDRAAAEYADGALALRLGARPTEIAVTIRGQSFRYFAVVTGVTERDASGTELLRRTVVAWNRMDHPDAILRLTSRSDDAGFGRAEELGRATGSWVNLTQGLRFSGVEGSLGTTLNATAGACPVGQRDARFTCHLARFGVRLDGVFELVGDATARVEITTQSPSVAGVVLQRTTGPSTDRPLGTVSDSRPIVSP
jgi:hypothetical protein